MCRHSTVRFLTRHANGTDWSLNGAALAVDACADVTPLPVDSRKRYSRSDVAATDPASEVGGRAWSDAARPLVTLQGERILALPRDPELASDVLGRNPHLGIADRLRGELCPRIEAGHLPAPARLLDPPRRCADTLDAAEVEVARSGGHQPRSQDHRLQAGPAPPTARCSTTSRPRRRSPTRSTSTPSRRSRRGLWDLIRRRPRSLEAAVKGAVAHQLAWTEQHPDLARFVYLRWHLDWEAPAGEKLAELNRGLATAFREWMAPLAESGDVRQTSMLMITAIVSGPAHAIARRWLAGQIESRLTAFADELADAACAGLRGTRVRSRLAARRSPRQGRLTLELVAEDGSVAARGQATTELFGLELPTTPVLR